MTTRNARIFLVREDQTGLLPMVEEPYDAEKVLQELLARYPDLIPGDQIDPENPRRWLLVKRELAVPATDEGRRFSLDHLFLDQDGIPTFVECKRATDTRGRREVVGQMLDYAANGLEYWGMEHVRQKAAETANERGSSLDAEVEALIDAEDEAAVEGYWKKVEANLHQGRVRLIFVADETPRELRRLVEFLNSNMPNVDVFAVEIKQFLGKGQNALVPRLIGFTETKTTTPRPDGSGHTTRTEFLGKCTPEARLGFESILRAAEARKHTIYWGGVRFSLKAFLPNTNCYISYSWGTPPNRIDFRIGHVPFPGDVAVRLRTQLHANDLFKDTGGNRLVATFDPGTRSQIESAFKEIMDAVDALVAADKAVE